MSNPHIHFIEASTIPECETKVNAWIDELAYECNVMNINVMPMIIESKLIYVTVVTFMPRPAYMPSGGSPR